MTLEVTFICADRFNQQSEPVVAVVGDCNSWQWAWMPRPTVSRPDPHWWWETAPRLRAPEPTAAAADPSSSQSATRKPWDPALVPHTELELGSFRVSLGAQCSDLPAVYQEKFPESYSLCLWEVTWLLQTALRNLGKSTGTKLAGLVSLSMVLTLIFNRSTEVSGTWPMESQTSFFPSSQACECEANVSPRIRPAWLQPSNTAKPPF